MLEPSLSLQYFEQYCSENEIDVNFPYNSGHVHVPGKKSLALSEQGPAEPPVDAAEASDFISNGYFCLKDAVSKESVEQARQYIDDNYNFWQSISKRSDDWRCHFELRFDRLSSPVEHGKLLDLLFASPKVMAKVRSLIGEPSGIFYTQIALRTPIKKLKSPEHTHSLNNGRGDYHIDGQANDSGVRCGASRGSAVLAVSVLHLSTYHLLSPQEIASQTTGPYK